MSGHQRRRRRRRRRQRPRYPNEDTTPTTAREIRGWYAYGVAAEVFAVCGLGSFLPLILEQLARENGVLRGDGITPCVGPVRAAGRAGRAEAGEGAATRGRGGGGGGKEDAGGGACVVHIFGTTAVNTSSFALYTFSLAVGVQALVLISISAIADHGSYRKRFLMLLAWMGAAACMSFVFVSPGVYLLAPLLVVISVCCLGSSFALLNSFIPVLVAHHPGVEDKDKDKEEEELEDGVIELCQPASSLREADGDDTGAAATAAAAARDGLQLSNQISARGMGYGYAAALLMQVLSIGILMAIAKLHITTSSTLPMRLVLFTIGTWWAVFSIPTYLWLRDRPGPRLPNIPITSRRWLLPWHYTTFAWRSLYRTAQVAVKLKQVLLFLVAWFLLSDSIATVSGVAILFARTELHMETPAIACISITATASGLAGSLLWPRLQQRFAWKSTQTIIACICLFEFIPLYGLLGFVLPILGLRQAWEIFPLAMIHGFVMGGLSSFCRAFFARLVPPGSEAAFYALYAVTDKGSSVIGPAVVGRIVDATGSVRSGFFFLAVLVVLPVPLVRLVDAEVGREDAVRMAETLRKSHERSVSIHGVGDDDDDDDDDDNDELEELGLLGAEEDEAMSSSWSSLSLKARDSLV